jgi:hypothetical protein
MALTSGNPPSLSHLLRGGIHTSGETPVVASAEALDQFRSVQELLRPGLPASQLTTSIMDSGQSAYLAIPHMEPVVEEVMVPQEGGGQAKELTLRPSVVGRITLFEQTGPEPLDRSAMTLEGIQQALAKEHLAPVMTILVSDGQRPPAGLVGTGFLNNPELREGQFPPDVCGRTVLLGSPNFFPLDQPFQPEEGVAIVGPDPRTDGDVDVKINAFMYGREGGFTARQLGTPGALQPIGEGRAFLGVWLGVDGEGNLGVLGRDTYLDEPDERGPVAVFHTREKLAPLPGSPMRSDWAQRQLGALGIVAPPANVPGPGPTPAAAPEGMMPSAPAEPGAAEHDDLVDASVGPDLAALMDQQVTQGYIVGPGRTGGRVLGRLKRGGPKVPQPFQPNS